MEVRDKTGKVSPEVRDKTGKVSPEVREMPHRLID